MIGARLRITTVVWQNACARKRLARASSIPANNVPPIRSSIVRIAFGIEDQLRARQKKSGHRPRGSGSHCTKRFNLERSAMLRARGDAVYCGDLREGLQIRLHRSL